MVMKKRLRNSMVGYGDTVVSESDMVPRRAEAYALAGKTHMTLLYNNQVKETRLQRPHAIDSIYMTFCERQNYSCRNQIRGSWAWVREGADFRV